MRRLVALRRRRVAAAACLLTAALCVLHGRGSVLVVATGANSAYFGGLQNLVGSVARWCPRCRVAVFDLGLTAEQVAEARTWCRTTVHWGGRTGQRDPNVYAFKAEAVHEAVETYGAALWLDAGSTVTGWLYESVAPLLFGDGYLLVQGQDLGMLRWVHPGMLAWFGRNASEFAGLYSFSGNTVGFVRGSRAARAILPAWLACSRDPACISPPGGSKADHRYDQAALSVIVHTSGLGVTPHTEVLASERPGVCNVPSFPKVVWTSRQAERCYAGERVC
jgi:hypothetical protein